MSEMSADREKKTKNYSIYGSRPETLRKERTVGEKWTIQTVDAVNPLTNSLAVNRPEGISQTLSQYESQPRIKNCRNN